MSYVVPEFKPVKVFVFFQPVSVTAKPASTQANSKSERVWLTVMESAVSLPRVGAAGI